MAWTTIAEADSVEELQRVTPTITDIPNVSPVLITITLPWYLPMAYVANLAGAEWVAEKLNWGLDVSDVRAADLFTIEIRGEARGWLVVAAVAAVAALILALTIFGIPAISHVLIAYEQTKQAEIQQTTEAARIVATNDLVARGYDLTEINAWLAGITTPTVQQQADDPSLMDTIKKAVTPAITIGTVVLIGALILFGMQYLPKPRRSAA